MGSPTFIGYIYLVINLVNGKQYIGCTRLSIKRRWTQHLSSARKGEGFALHAAIRKYGETNFKVSIIESVEGLDSDLKDAEVRQIKAHGCVSPCGYNLTYGGDGPDYSVEGVREKHLEAVRKLPSDPLWVKALKDGILRRQSDPTYRKRQAEACRISGLSRRSTNCTQCGIPLTESNSSRRSWCVTCNREYQRLYQYKRGQRRVTTDMVQV